ncbi:MAG: tRNA pseudouridine(38-40) synthase TruA [Myxococcota bacterium]
MNRTLRLFIEYDGTQFSGWQTQAGVRTVQRALEDGVQAMTRTVVSVRGASRTDAGVHARGQVAAFDTDSSISALSFERGLNRYLPDDVVVWRVEEAEPGWNPKRNARGKRYTYCYWTGFSPPALERHRVWHVRGALDAERMHAAAQQLKGTHDFESFRATGCVARHAVRSMYDLSVRVGCQRRVHLEVVGNAFVRNMVRIMAGTLAEVGLERRPPELESVLRARDRASAGVTAPPQGLFLDEVVYDERLPPRPRDDEHWGE